MEREFRKGKNLITICNFTIKNIKYPFNLENKPKNRCKLIDAKLIQLPKK